MNALEDLLGELFSAEELRRFIGRLDGGEKLVAALDGEASAKETLFHKAVRVLNRRGEIDEGFFKALVEERPKKAARVRDIERTWIADLPARSATDPGAARTPHDPALLLRLLEVEERLGELQPRLRPVRVRYVRDTGGGPLLWTDTFTGEERVLKVGETGEECAEFVANWMASLSAYLEVLDPNPLPPPPKDPTKLLGEAAEFRRLQKERDRLRTVLGLTPASANNHQDQPASGAVQSAVLAAASQPSGARGNPTPIRVFLSYSQDTPAHKDAVRALADRLRADGIDAWIDQYVASPPEGWPRWMANQVEQSRYIVLVCTETYKRRFEGREVAGAGKGATWEGQLATQVLYDNGTVNEKLVPVLLDGASDAHIPLALRPYSHYRLPEGYDALYRHLTGQPAVVAPPLGAVRAMPPVARGPALAPQQAVSAGLPIATTPQPDRGDARLQLRLLEVEDELAEKELRSKAVRVRYVRNLWPGSPGTYSGSNGTPTEQTIVLQVGGTGVVHAEYAACLLADYGDAFEVLDPGPLPPVPEKRGTPLPSADELRRLRMERDRLKKVLGMEEATRRIAEQASQVRGAQRVINHDPVGQQINIQGGSHVFNLGKGNG